jgi:DNA-3-methyladenine glycosylase
MAYVYFNYGVHWMLNVTAHKESRAAGVLVRAAVPLEGVDTMRERRRALPDHQLLSGPGKLTQAFAITNADQGVDLLDLEQPLHIEAPSQATPFISGPRVGIALGKGHETPWRFIDREFVAWASKPVPSREQFADRRQGKDAGSCAPTSETAVTDYKLTIPPTA